MDDLYLNPFSRELLELYCQHPKHALLLEGEKGVGTLAVAKHVAEKIAQSDAIMLVTPEKNTISIDTVRGLYAATRSARERALVVIIDDADAMGIDAQNALLKLLEEPPMQVYFVLTTHAPHHLLQTILSRTEHITLRAISQEASEKVVSDLGVTDAAERAKLLFLASGKPSELIRLIHDKDYYEASSAMMVDARSFLGGERYNRLILLKKYMTDRENAERFLITLGQLASFSMYRSVADGTLKALDAVNDALEAIHNNGNVRAQLLLLSDRLS